VRDVVSSNGERGRHRRSAQRRRAGALIGALAIHLLVFALAFSSASGRPVSSAGVSGGPVGSVLTVTVVRLSQLPGAPHDAAANLPSILARRTPSPTGEALPIGPHHPPSDVASLLQRIEAQAEARAPDDRPRPEKPSDAQGSRSPSPAPVSRSQRVVYDGARDASGEASGSPSTGRLWGAIEPCWRNLGARGRVPVVLEVVLDGTGDLRVPPRVVRDANALITEPRLQAEASALAAVAACAPRGNLAFASKTYRLEFPAAP